VRGHGGHRESYRTHRDSDPFVKQDVVLGIIRGFLGDGADTVFGGGPDLAARFGFPQAREEATGQAPGG
jgi:hypothetical protein